VKDFRRLEKATTQYLVPTSAAVIAVAVGGFWILLSAGVVSIDPLSKFVDVAAKTIAVSVGTLWALNRYFIGRTDAPQIRVDAHVDLLSAAQMGGDTGLLVYRLDVVNTGKTLIPPFHQFCELDAISITNGTVDHQTLNRWPDEGRLFGGPIEPGSWAALNAECPVPKGVRAVRLYLEISLRDGTRWTWHRSFALKPEKANG
jgi:hypothetical protein